MVSISKIALATGVSRTAVSFILNGKARELRLADETVKKVLAYCESVGYAPNIHARRMRSKFAANILVLLNHGRNNGEVNPFSDYNAAMMAGGIANAAERVNYTFKVVTGDPAASGEQIFKSLRSRESDGLIVYGSPLLPEWVERFGREGRAAVEIGTVRSDCVSAVGVEHTALSRELTSRVVARGRRNYLYISGGIAGGIGGERYRGFCQALAAAGLDPEAVPVVEANYSEARAYEIARELPAAKLPDAIVCANDYMAFGVLRALRERGIDVPSQISVTGGDNVAAARYVSPGLSTFDNRPQQLGEKAFEVLMVMLAGEAPGNYRIESEIVLRESI